MVMEPLQAIRNAIATNRLVWRQHALMRMMERRIRRQDVRNAIQGGEVIKQYPNDKPFPSLLIAGRSQGRMLHSVAAYDNGSAMCYIVTTYEPNTEHFESDLKTRR